MLDFPHMKSHDALTDSPKKYSSILLQLLFCKVSEKEREEKVKMKAKRDGVINLPYNKPVINSVNVFFVQSIPVHISF